MLRQITTLTAVVVSWKITSTFTNKCGFARDQLTARIFDAYNSKKRRFCKFCDKVSPETWPIGTTATVDYPQGPLYFLPC